MRRVTLWVSLCLGVSLSFALAGCTREASCEDEPDNRFCQEACEDDPSLPHCDGDVDAGPIDGGGEDAGPRDAGPDAGDVDVDAGPPCGGPCEDTGRPVCDAVRDMCVACTAADNRCSSAAPMCIDNQCAQCASDTDCTEPNAARCEAGRCVACDSDADCEGLTGLPACADGVCRQCEAGRTENQCGGSVCLLDDTCSDTITDGATPACDPCTVSEQCAGGGVCVEALRFEPSIDEGPRCVFLDDGAGCAPHKPFGAREVGAQTREGATVTTCRPITTCAALATHGTPCSDDGPCGFASASSDAFCQASSCTYRCSDDRHCSGACVGPVSGRYCSE